MAGFGESFIQNQLVERRERLEAALEQAGADPHLQSLLREVDAALARLKDGTYGLCQTCHDPIEAERLAANPLLSYCVDHLTPEERRALEQDLELAAEIQSRLLPERHLRSAGWEAYYHYERFGPVGGDYCDLVQADGDGLVFLLGDATGKGVSASMLMSQLHAIFRTLLVQRLPVDQLLERANRILCESVIPTHFATVVCGRADRRGLIELANAGHCPPLVVSASGTRTVAATGLPLGMFCDSKYDVTSLQLASGESLLLYTDGLSEACNPAEIEYGKDRLLRLAAQHHALAPQDLINTCLGDLSAFLAGTRSHDDLTIMAIRRAA